MRRTKLISVSIGLLVSTAVAASGSVTLSPIESGYIGRDARIPDPDDPAAFFVRQTANLFFDGEPEVIRRGFLFFDLTSVTEPVNAAILRFNVARLDNAPPGPAVATVFLHDVTTTREASLRDSWTDLGSGVLYNSKSLIEDSDVGVVVELDLGPTAVDNINLASEQFGIGVRARLDHDTARLEMSEHDLLLETSPAAVPEPPSLIIFSAFTCLGLLTCGHRFKGTHRP